MLRGKLVRLVLAGAMAGICGNALGADAKAPTEADLLATVRHVPAGFHATIFAMPPTVHYPTCLSATLDGTVYIGIDENGSLDQKPGRGRVVRAIDRDNDGRADDFLTVAKMDSPRGIVYDGKVMYVLHPPELTAYFDDNGDGVMDRSTTLVKGVGHDLKFRGADHTTNGIRMGIDGWIYIAMGDYGCNAVGTDGTHLVHHGGGIVRVRPDGSEMELYCEGTRNIYDVAIDPLMNVFTRDNTNDGGGWNDRLSHILPYGYYGYPSRFMHFPGEFVPALADYGGGSPCGSLFLDEPGFPGDYGHGLYTCEWGRSAVFRHPLTPDGSTFKAGQTTFLEMPRVTDMDVDGQSRLYISSWKDGGFTYSTPWVGYVAELRPDNAPATKVIDLAKAPDAQLASLMESPSATWRLQVQQEMLRRGAKPVFVSSLQKLIESDRPIEQRVAAIFTLKQLQGSGANLELAQACGRPELREFAFRAMTDRLTQLEGVPAGLLVSALGDPNPRVRLAAVVGLGRIGQAATAPAMVALLGDRDFGVAHSAMRALVRMRAWQACMQVMDSSSPLLAPGAGLVLGQIHEMPVVDGLLQRLGQTDSPEIKTVILRTLCRLCYREADWNGDWWGTRPDTSGPYFRPVEWEGTARIKESLASELTRERGSVFKALVLDLQKSKVDLPHLTETALALAKQDPAFRAPAVQMLAMKLPLADEAIGFMAEIAGSEKEPGELRATALRALVRSDRKPSAMQAATTVLSDVGRRSPGELQGVWEEFVRDNRNQGSIETFVKLAAQPAPGAKELGYAVLMHTAGSRTATAVSRTASERALEQGWMDPASLAPMLLAVGRMRAQQYAPQIRQYLNDPRPEVKRAAEVASRQTGITADSPNKVMILSLPYDEVVRQALADRGNRRLGRQLFLAQGCVMCHTVRADDPPKGPYLGGIATRYSRSELLESILKPSAKIAQGFETQWFKTKDDQIEGFVSRESGDSVEVRNSAGIVVDIARKDILKRGKRDISVMPEGLVDRLSTDELASLLAYLESLRSK